MEAIVCVLLLIYGVSAKADMAFVAAGLFAIATHLEDLVEKWRKEE